MFNDQETIKKVKSFGLNTYEVKIWMALLGRGVSTAGELSDIANVPRSRSYDVLESLEKKGFVIMELGKPIKYLAVPPKEVMDGVRVRIEKNTKKHISEITNQKFNNLINELQEIHENSSGNGGNVVALLKGFKNIQRHLEFLFENSKKDILLSIEKDNWKHFETLTNTKNKNNLTLKKNIGLRLCLIGDDNAVIFPITGEDIHPDYDLGIWIKNKKTTKFLKRLLNSS